MTTMGQMTHFTRCLKVHAIMLLGALVGGTIRTKKKDEVKELIEIMFQNEYLSTSGRKIKLKGVLELYLNTIILAELEVNLKQLVVADIITENVSQVKTLWCDFMGKDMKMEIMY